MKKLILLVLMTLTFRAQAAAPVVSEIGCQVTAKRVVEATGVTAKINLLVPVNSVAAGATCFRITFKQTTLIAVKYLALDNLSNLRAPVKVNVYQVYHLENGKLRQAFGAPVDSGAPRWMVTDGLLALRVGLVDDAGKPMWGVGWILNPQTSVFEDYVVYAMDHNLPF